MESAQKTFISSTFWTERIGPAAAVATLEEMKRIKSWEIITAQGKKIQEGWKKLSIENDLELKCAGIPALSTFSIESENWLKQKTRPSTAIR